MNPKTLCERLLSAESELEVQQIVDSEPEMKHRSNWRPLDGRETNFNVTSNQASDGAKALTELMTNMVDAVLMKHAYLRHIDPVGPSAPKTMYEAVEKLIKPLHGGKLTNLDSSDPWIREFAQENLVIGVTGAKSKKSGLPCYTFVDNGEGQVANAFPKTFLSLSSGHKKEIPFVQGKYNMGSSGVLGYCGTKWFKLIVSRRFDNKHPWAFTLLRKRPSDKDEMPVAEYFVTNDGSVPSFDERSLRPFTKSNGEKYKGVTLSSGTVVKLYDYQVGSRFSSGFRGSREALNENLIDTILPFRILDFRQKPDPKRSGDRAEGIDPRPFCGMEFLLLRSHREREEDKDEDAAAATGSVPVGSYESLELGKISVYAVKLKRELPAWLANSNNRVFHAVNGQVQFKQTRGYLSQSCGFPALKDRVVVIVDASELTFAAHNDVWKGDREHVRDTLKGEKYKEVVTAVIKDSPNLKEFQHEVAQEELKNTTMTQRNDLFQKLLDKDRNLAALLTERDPVLFLPGSGLSGTKTEKQPKQDLKLSPTFLKFEKPPSGVVEIQISSPRPLIARTDAEDQFFERHSLRGELVVESEILKHFSVRKQLHDGRLVLFLLRTDEPISIGQTFILRAALKDPAMPEAVRDEIRLLVIADVPKPKPDGPRPPKPEPKQGGPSVGLPPYRLLTKDGRSIGDQNTEKWSPDFTELDGGAIEDLGEEGSLYKINYDNVYHLKYRLGARGDVARDALSEKYILGMRILLLGYEHAWRAVLQKRLANEEGGASEFQDEFRRAAARGAASTVLALAEHLPKIVDGSSASGTEPE